MPVFPLSMSSLPGLFNFLQNRTGKAAIDSVKPYKPDLIYDIWKCLLLLKREITYAQNSLLPALFL